MQPIHVKFNHTEKEYLAAARMLLFGQKELVARLIIILVLVWLGIMMISLLSEFEFPLWASFWIGLLVDASFVYVGLVDAPRRLFRKDSKMREQFELTFSEEGVALKTPQIDSKLAWSLYKRVLENKSLYVLVYDAPGRMAMTVVPKRVFRDASEELEFRRLVHRQIDPSVAFTNDSISDQNYAYAPSKLEPPDWR
ncbi:MAG TPA: YcxB family protein [Pyrinomonadaceae bacterium]|nr:YcxB family protein [Pyrinomonadaceae bacterium]